jgi:ribosome-interacting GTPase 1
MDCIRVYTKLPSRKEPDMENPFTVKTGQTLHDLAELIHRDFARNLKGARVWGAEVHDGTQVKGDYILHDKDIVEIHL